MRGDPDFESEISDADYSPQLNTLRALSVLGMIFGALGLASLPLGFVWFHSGSAVGDLEIRLRDETLMSFSMDALVLLLSALAGTGLCALLFCSSIASKNLNPFGRLGLIAFAIGSIALSVAGSFFYLRWSLPLFRDRTAAVRGVIPAYAEIVAAVIGFLLGLALLFEFSYPGVRSGYVEQEETSTVS